MSLGPVARLSRDRRATGPEGSWGALGVSSWGPGGEVGQQRGVMPLGV